MAARLRLDQALVARKLVATRSRARDAILRGCVSVDGRVVRDPAEPVALSAEVVLDDPAAVYVSRAALKLIAGLDAFGLSPAGRLCLDLGASTGGFTQVLLERGACSVVAVDVGHGQMADRLRDNPRVRVLERLNARDLESRHLPEPPGFVTADVSFIPLGTALAPALALAAPGAEGVFLVKPQFEVGPEHLSRRGLVTDPALAQAAAERASAFVDGRGWSAIGLAESPIRGQDGNAEFLLGARKAVS